MSEDKHPVPIVYTTRVDGEILLPTDIGREVYYVPLHVQNLPKTAWWRHPDVESGVIVSWDDKHVFVRYGHGLAAPKMTYPADLFWDLK